MAQCLCRGGGRCACVCRGWYCAPNWEPSPNAKRRHTAEKLNPQKGFESLSDISGDLDTSVMGVSVQNLKICRHGLDQAKKARRILKMDTARCMSDMWSSRPCKKNQMTSEKVL